MPNKRLIVLISIITLPMIAIPALASFESECSRKASRNSKDYRVLGSGSKYTTAIGSTTGKHKGTSLSSISRGIYGSSRNPTAYDANYQHCMSSYGR